VAAAGEDDHERDRCGRRLGDKHSLRGGHAGDDRDLTADEVGYERREPIALRPGKVVLDRHIAALDKAGLGETLTERRQKSVRSHPGRPAVEKPDHGHRLLLRARRERPRHRAAEQSDELASLHSITSSARASSVAGTSRPKALAVLRLITSSNLVDCTTGRSAGFMPLSIRPA